MFPEPRKKWFFWRGNFHHFQNKEVFEAEFAVYSIALKASGYNNELQYTEKTGRQGEISEEKCDLVQPSVES